MKPPLIRVKDNCRNDQAKQKSTHDAGYGARGQETIGSLDGVRTLPHYLDIDDPMADAETECANKQCLLNEENSNSGQRISLKDEVADQKTQSPVNADG